jgi:hypothetical protein
MNALRLQGGELTDDVPFHGVASVTLLIVVILPHFPETRRPPC